MSNKKFTSIKNDFCITIDISTEIEVVTDDTHIKKTGFCFTEISSMKQMTMNQNVDVIGIVVEISPLLQFTTKANEKKD